MTEEERLNWIELGYEQPARLKVEGEPVSPTLQRLIDPPVTSEDKSFTREDVPVPHASVQWKGTDVCLDFTCRCGATGHIDGAFVYVVKCPVCGSLWEMPYNIFPREADERTYPYWRARAVEFEVDDP